MAHADGVLDSREEALIDHLCDQMDLSVEAHREVAEMVKHPPSPEQIARWNVTDQDRRGVYVLAIKMAEADGVVDPNELAMLDQLAAVLQLTPEQCEAASRLVKEVQP
jgi:tellurite resistance protein